MVSLFPLSSNKKNDIKTLPIKKIDKNFIITPLYKYKETPCDICLSGMLTVEAAWILPLTICFFVCILFLFRVMQMQIVMQGAVSRAAGKLAVSMADEENRKVTEAAVRLVLEKELLDTKNVADYIENGLTGIHLSHSDWSGENVSLVAHYQVKCPITVFGKINISLVSKAVCHKWIGWAGGDSESNSDVWVYVTETGSVYHYTEECTYLNLSVKSITETELEDMRNENGGKYYPCQLCAAGSNPNTKGQIYITNQGSSYHYKLRCSGLKRTIYCIRLSEVGDRKPCSRCGGT